MSSAPDPVYQRLWDQEDVMVSWHGASGSYKAASPGAAHVIGWPAERIVGQNPYPLLHPDDLKVIAEYHDLLWSEHFAHQAVVFRIKGEDGEFRWLVTQTRRSVHPEWGPVSVSVSRRAKGFDGACVITTKEALLSADDADAQSG